MQRKSPYQESTSQNIMAVILQSLPQESGLTKIEYEGPRIALYSKNPSYLMQNNQLVSNMVNTIKKRIVIRTDESIRRPQDESARIIADTIPKEVGVAGTFFDAVLGEAVLFAKKPWMLAQVGEDLDNIELAEKTGWKVRVRKAPKDIAPIEALYKILGETVSERTKFYREVGDKIFRDKLSESAEASLMTLGGFAEVGRSCMLLTTPESKVLLDCGLNPSAKDSLAAMPRFDVAGIGMEEIDAVLLSHAHMDHAGFLPALYKYGYGGPVYCTEPTLLLMSMLQKDYVRCSGDLALYSEKDIDSAVTHTITLTHGIVTDISPDVKLVLSNSGHILGSTSVHLHIGNGDHNLVYTGDMKFGRTLALENASWNFPRVETMIIESTYGGKEDIICPREEAEARLASSISKTVSAGGHVLLPVPVVGISQEIILVLDRFMKGVQAKVLVEKSISKATAIYEAYPEFLSKELRQRVLESEASQFGSQFSIVESQLLKIGEPAVILAPSSMLLGGPSVDYLKQIAADPCNRLIMLPYQAVETPGRAIQDGARQVAIRGETINLQCQVERIDGFASHSDYNQTMEYVKRLRPKLRRVLVNHGERPKAQNLASSINKFFKIQTQHPLVQEAIKLL
ncbi:MAG: MBL fold metallo-hydrolase [Candidatus Nitrososphaera sp. 13_1_40CM_48_12]|nr:MAG: MBL fold metallo-hydrolase [Candidatus Nitrososphaera sp. 13_1_40CM_48_12]